MHPPGLASGEGLVFMHGAGTRGEVWQLQALAFPLARTPDLAGRDGEGTPTSVAAHLASLRPSLAHAAVLVGHSLGGAVALQYALESPSGLRGLILMGTGARFPEAQGWSAKLAGGEAALAELADGFYGSAAPPRIREKSLALLRALDRRVLSADVRAAEAFDVRDRLGGLLTPALIVAGTEDRMVPPQQAEFLHAHLPRAELVWIEGAGHLVMLERPEETNQAIRAFLRQLDG